MLPSQSYKTAAEGDTPLLTLEHTYNYGMQARFGLLVSGKGGGRDWLDRVSAGQPCLSPPAAAAALGDRPHGCSCAVLQGPKWNYDTKVLAGFALSAQLADDAQLKQALAKKRWHHVLLSAALPSTCTLRIDGQLVARATNCSLAAIFPYCRPNSNISVIVGSLSACVWAVLEMGGQRSLRTACGAGAACLHDPHAPHPPFSPTQLRGRCQRVRSQQHQQHVRPSASTSLPSAAAAQPQALPAASPPVPAAAAPQAAQPTASVTAVRWRGRGGGSGFNAGVVCVWAGSNSSCSAQQP